MSVPLSANCTVPVGTETPLTPLTVAVRVVLLPKTSVGGISVSTVVGVTSGACTTVMLKFALALKGLLSESVMVTVNVEVPGVVGVPAIVPVAELSVSPFGNVPLETLHANGATPPSSLNVCE